MTEMFRRILVAVDSSREARLALDQAVKLAGELGATVRLVSVVAEHASTGSRWETPSSHAAALAKRRSEARALLERMSGVAKAAGVAAETELAEISEGGPGISEAIVKAASRWPAELIVLGTHGRQGLERMVLGSVAEGVARQAPAPVLLVRNAAGSRE